MNTRQKGNRTFNKARRYALSYPGTTFLAWYQPPWYAAPQPFDAMLFLAPFYPRLIEVRTNQWGISKPSTRQLAALPPDGIVKQIWRFKDRYLSPDIREWSGTAWVHKDYPWDGCEPSPSIVQAHNASHPAHK